MPRGKPFEPGNKYGRGRPKRSLNKTTKAARALIDEYAEPVARKALAMALEGDTTLMRFFVNRIAPVGRSSTLKMRRLEIGSITEVASAFEEIFKQMTRGELSIHDALGISEMIEKRRRLIETEDPVPRLEALESEVRSGKRR